MLQKKHGGTLCMPQSLSKIVLPCFSIVPLTLLHKPPRSGTNAGNDRTSNRKHSKHAVQAFVSAWRHACCVQAASARLPQPDLR